MYQHILIPTDGSEIAEKAVEAGTNYAREAGAKVLFFTAIPEYQPPGDAQMMARQRVKSIFEYENDAAEAARAILDKAAATAKDANISFETDFALCDQPYQAIIEAAKRHGCDAIFMASHGRSGIPAWWYGSQTREVLTHSDIPTLVYR
ncbi:MAG TPA: universal stress protein [Burkholderiales bacterium]|jgi:nucleotide-binding universal stress UspA family protein